MKKKVEDLIVQWQKEAADYKKIAVNGYQTMDSHREWNGMAEICERHAKQLEQLLESDNGKTNQ